MKKNYDNKQNEVKTQKKRKLKQLLIDNIDELFVLPTLIAFVIFSVAFSKIENYPNWVEFLLVLLLTGCVFGYFIYLILSFFIDNIDSYKSYKDIGVRSYLIVFFSLFFMGIGPFVNEYSYKVDKCGNYVIKDKEKKRKNSKFYVLINTGNKTEWLNFSYKIYNTYNIGDKIQLCVLKGFLGYKYYLTQDHLKVIQNSLNTNTW